MMGVDETSLAVAGGRCVGGPVEDGGGGQRGCFRVAADGGEAVSELTGIGWRQGLTLPVRVIVWADRRSRLGMVAVGDAGVGVAWSRGRQ